MRRAEFVPLTTFDTLTEDEMRESARAFLEKMRRRRTVRDFSDRPVPRDVVEACILAGGTAPNGAHRQPWRFVVVGDPAIKSKIREEAEIEERAFYRDRRRQSGWTRSRTSGRTSTSDFWSVLPG